MEKYRDNRRLHYVEGDTDSLYFAISGEMKRTMILLKRKGLTKDLNRLLFLLSSSEIEPVIVNFSFWVNNDFNFINFNSKITDR
jgi:hypothetical protein